MGHAVADLARERGYTITTVLGFKDNASGSGISRDRLGETDVVI